MAECPPKRSKISRGEDHYKPGNITEIELHNFMTFSDVKCKPGLGLNLVVGPNGSGKSTIVCAIALGLGGEPQLLGRASSIRAFVKRGKESGYIRISLRGFTKEEQLIITRKINTSNNSEWLFNGKVVGKEDVIEVTRRFNIQVNNLTQFLPQDKVCEFAKLTPIQLLKETEKAVGDPQLPVYHEALVDKSNELKKLERTIQNNKEYLDQLKALNAEQERDVERFRQRGELLGKVDSMKKKLSWLKYDMKKAKCEEAIGQETGAKKNFDEVIKELNEASEPMKKHKEEKVTQDAECKKVTGFLDGNVKRRIQLMEKENQLGVQVRGKYNEVEDLWKQEKTQQEDISKAKEELDAAEQELANLPPLDDPKDEVEKLKGQILELKETAGEKIRQKSEKERTLAQTSSRLKKCIDKLMDLKDTKYKLLRALQKSGAMKIFEAYRWVQDHRHEFNKEVYGPVLLEVKVSHRTHADYIEGHIPYYIWKSFITQDSDDSSLLVKNIGPMDVAVINYVGHDHHDRERFQVSEEMRDLGIYSRLDQVFDAPNAVREVLIGQFGLKDSYIGSKETDQRAYEIHKLGISDCWTPENHYRLSKSRYGSYVGAIVKPVDHSRLLLCNQDVGAIEMLGSAKKELEDSISVLDGFLESVETELGQVKDERAKLKRQRAKLIEAAEHEKKTCREMENRINQKKINLRLLESVDDLDTTRRNLINHAAILNSKRVQCAIEIKNLIIEAVALRRSFADKRLASIELEGKIRAMEKSIKQQEKTSLQASLHLEYCKKEVMDCMHQLSAAKRHAESVATMTLELKQEFLEMPETIEELMAAIQETNSQANSIFLFNQHILEEYESRKYKIEELSKKHDSDKKEYDQLLADVNGLKESWLLILRNLVGQINETFGRNFQEMAVAGEVSLDEHDMDFDKYGILIKVKFRQAGKLQVLSGHHQSGGERSVSTILYLVSLQDITNCPFRVVDEINQGMDPINERKMFQQLVRAASQVNTPQCFLLTPKLLPNLEYSEACSILTVMNGPWIEQPSKEWSNGDCWGSVKDLFDGSGPIVRRGKRTRRTPVRLLDYQRGRVA